MTSSAYRLYLTDTFRNLLPGQSQQVPYRTGSKSIVDGMASRKGHFYRKNTIIKMHLKTASEQAFIHTVCCKDIILFRQSETNRSLSFDHLYGNQFIVISIDTDGTVFSHKVKHFCFGLQNTVSGTKKFQMALSDIGKQANIRFRHLTKPMHFAKVVYAHFQNGNLMLRSNTENG